MADQGWLWRDAATFSGYHSLFTSAFEEELSDCTAKKPRLLFTSRLYRQRRNAEHACPSSFPGLIILFRLR